MNLMRWTRKTNSRIVTMDRVMTSEMRMRMEVIMILRMKARATEKGRKKTSRIREITMHNSYRLMKMWSQLHLSWWLFRDQLLQEKPQSSDLL